MGYDAEYFLSNDGGGVDETLLCPICHEVYDTPMVLDPCGHSFCRECVATLLDSGHEDCPICRTKMIEGVGVGVPPNRALKDLISNMKVRCMNCPINDGISTSSDTTTTATATNCCPWTGKLSEFQSHSESVCPMHMVSCPIEGCNFEGPRSSMNQHNADSVALHTDLLIASKLESIKEELLGMPRGTGNHVSNGSGSIDGLQDQLDQKDHEISMLKARLLDNLWSDFFKEWIFAKPPFFKDFVVYRPIKYLTGPISQIIVGIPGPGNSDWEGGLYPLLITFIPEGFERKEPPKCDFPETFFHPNVYEGNVHVNTLAEFDGSWDPSISLQEIFFCIQQLLNHPNHRGSAYDPEEYRESVRFQAEKYNRSGTDFLERAMVDLQSKIDPEYKMPLESWENERWENLEEVRWKGRSSFQPREEAVGFDSIGENNDESNVANNDESNDENNDENNEDVVGETPEPMVEMSGRSVLAPISNANSIDLSPRVMPIESGRLCDENGKICECSCCEQGSRSFIDRKHRMRYIFGEGG